MNIILIFQFLVLLMLANGTPVIARKILGTQFSAPLDGGYKLSDGQPLFGHSKTIRGLVVSLVVTMAVAPFFGLSWSIGLLIALGAMAGDLISSFVKRRMKLAPSSQAIGLDQIPESLVPSLLCMNTLLLTFRDIAAIVVIFLVGALLISRLLYYLNIRQQPY